MFLASLNFLCEKRTRELTVLIILPMQVCIRIHQLRLKSQRINLCFVHNPYAIFATLTIFATLLSSRKILTCTLVITGTQCSVCAFLSAFCHLFMYLCLVSCLEPLVAEYLQYLQLPEYLKYLCISICVFVYLCICVFVYLGFCVFA